MAKVHRKGRWPATRPGLPSCQISLPCFNPRRRYPLQNILQTQLQTNNDISWACLWACGDNDIISRHLHSRENRAETDVQMKWFPAETSDPCFVTVNSWPPVTKRASYLLTTRGIPDTDLHNHTALTCALTT